MATRTTTITITITTTTSTEAARKMGRPSMKEELELDDELLELEELSLGSPDELLELEEDELLEEELVPGVSTPVLQPCISNNPVTRSSKKLLFIIVIL
jgi:hypothetical protein